MCCDIKFRCFFITLLNVDDPLPTTIETALQYIPLTVAKPSHQPGITIDNRQTVTFH